MYETQVSSADKIMQHLADAPCLSSLFPILEEPTEDTLCTTMHKTQKTTIIATPARCG